jgi:hypothetical protein
MLLRLLKPKAKNDGVKTQRELIREHLQKVSLSYEVDRDASLNSFTDIYSLVCFINDDFPTDKQNVHVSECIAEYMFTVGHSQDSINWIERRKLVGRRENTIIFKLPADHMQSLYSEHITTQRSGKRSSIKTVSVMNYNGTAYPVAFCLGFLWGSQSEKYKEYPSVRI